MKIGMYMMCRKSNNPSVQAFALDHINDVVVNAVGLFGAHAAPYIVQHQRACMWECRACAAWFNMGSYSDASFSLTGTLQVYTAFMQLAPPSLPGERWMA